MNTPTKLAKDGTRRGRPLGSASVMAKEAREKAQATGKLPHEILLDIARGEPQCEKTLDPATGEIKERLVPVSLDMRLDAAKAAAPYFAPKISTVEVLAGATEDELDRIIAQLASEAGVSLGAGIQSQTGEEEDGGGGDGVTGGPQQPAGPPALLRQRPVTGSRS